MRSKRKKIRKISIAICIICMLIIAGIYFYDDIKKLIVKDNKITDVGKDNTDRDKNKDKDKVKEPVKPVEEVTPTSYLNEIKNSTNVEIKKEWQDLIIEYMNMYYKSMYTLKVEDFTKLFSNAEKGYITQSATSMLIEHRLLQPNDMHLTSGKYDINFTKVEYAGNNVKISFLENDYLKFKYLDGIETKAFGVENTITLSNVNGVYKIAALDKVQDYFVMFTRIYSSVADYKTALDSLKTKYINSMKTEVEREKKLKEEAKAAYVAKKTCDNSYDRQKAVDYSYKYITTRNKSWVAYDTWGGNCQNFVSQCIHEGGIPMDYSGADQWKHYSSTLNNSNTASGRTVSWVGVGDFYYYAKNNTGYGLCSDVDINLFQAEGGDIGQVGYTATYSHTIFIAKQVKDKDGNVIDLLVNSNTVNLENFPFLAYPYPNKRIIKVLGWNN